jgi:hypothetical protein
VTSATAAPPLRIFISYASEQVELARQVHQQLSGNGFDAFLDQRQLVAGAPFDAALHERIAQWADAAIVLVSAEYVQAGRFTLEEVQRLQARWPHSTGQVMPIRLAADPALLHAMPAYLAAMHAPLAEHNVARQALRLALDWRQRHREEEAARQLHTASRWRRVRRIVAVGGLTLALGAAAWGWREHRQQQARDLIKDIAGASGYRSGDATRATLGALGVKHDAKKGRGEEARFEPLTQLAVPPALVDTRHGELLATHLHALRELGLIEGSRYEALAARLPLRYVRQEVRERPPLVEQINRDLAARRLQLPAGNRRVVSGVVRVMPPLGAPATAAAPADEVLVYLLSKMCWGTGGELLDLEVDHIGSTPCRSGTERKPGDPG